MYKGNLFNYIKTGQEISFYLVRHGESATNMDSSLFLSNCDYPMTKKGVSQIKKLGVNMDKNINKFNYIFCSSMLRSRQTSNILAKQFHLNTKNIYVSTNLNELNIGEWNNKKKKECLSNRNKGKLFDLDKWFSTFEGESGINLQNRALQWIESEILALKITKDTKILVCAHSYWIKLFLQLIFNFDYKYVNKIKIDYASVSLLKLNDEGWSLEYLNNKF
ncbi:MAG: histidine phosphatase family protein [Patescibacteria group bacterium]|nr:histidine phosphatase family protein [Patescibacteria group bacterium]